MPVLKSTCVNCRKRKVKCDGLKPTCERCIHSGRLCCYQSKARFMTFRHSKLSSSWDDSQPSNFPSNTSESEAGPRSGSGSESILGARSDYRIEAEVPEQSQNYAETPDSPSADVIEEANQLQSPEPISYPGDCIPPSSAIEQPLRGSTSAASSSFTPATSIPTPVTSVHERQSQTSAESGSRLREGLDISLSSKGLSPLEGELLSFYVCNIGPWLDVTSPERHYTYTVPNIAFKRPLLLHAILSCSAHILRLICRDRTDLYDAESDHQHRCLRMLIPMLDDYDAAMQDEVVLAAITILRMSEQYHEFHIDQQFHMVPQAFDHFRAFGPSSSTGSGGLREATFYSYIRADIRMAVLGRCGTKMKPENWPLDVETLITDADWANRMTYLLVHTLNLCLGGYRVPGLLPRAELVRLIDEWMSSVPSSFKPYYFQESSKDRPFPTVYVLCPWHIVGLQFYHAAKLLLATQMIHENTDCTSIFNLSQYISTEILYHARMLCAISLSNTHHGCRINASHLFALSAQFFTGRLEQHIVLNYLEDMENDKGWPSQSCREMVKQVYGLQGECSPC